MVACRWRDLSTMLAKGAMEIVEREGDVFAFTRTHGNAGLFCAFNLGEEDVSVTLPGETWRVDEDAPFAPPAIEGGTATLRRGQALFATNQGED